MRAIPAIVKFIDSGLCSVFPFSLFAASIIRSISSCGSRNSLLDFNCFPRPFSARTRLTNARMNDVSTLLTLYVNTNDLSFSSTSEDISSIELSSNSSCLNDSLTRLISNGNISSCDIESTINAMWVGSLEIVFFERTAILAVI